MPPCSVALEPLQALPLRSAMMSRRLGENTSPRQPFSKRQKTALCSTEGEMHSDCESSALALNASFDCAGLVTLILFPFCRISSTTTLRLGGVIGTRPLSTVHVYALLIIIIIIIIIIIVVLIVPRVADLCPRQHLLGDNLA